MAIYLHKWVRYKSTKSDYVIYKSYIILYTVDFGLKCFRMMTGRHHVLFRRFYNKKYNKHGLHVWLRLVRLVAATVRPLVQAGGALRLGAATATAPQHVLHLLETLAGVVDHTPRSCLPFERQSVVQVPSSARFDGPRGFYATAADATVVATPSTAAGRCEAIVVGRGRTPRRWWRLVAKRLAVPVVTDTAVSGLERGQVVRQRGDPLPPVVRLRLLVVGLAFFDRWSDVPVAGALPHRAQFRPRALARLWPRAGTPATAVLSRWLLRFFSDRFWNRGWIL